VENEAYEAMAGRIVDAVARGCDAVLLDLHGAMVTRSFDDGEGELLARIRKVAPEVRSASRSTCTPPVPGDGPPRDRDRGLPRATRTWTCTRRAARRRPILSLLQKSSIPKLVFGHRPMLPHVMRQSSLDSPNKEIQARAREMEREGAMCASFFVGFPHADIPYAGSSAVVVTDGDVARAQALCDELLDMHGARASSSSTGSSRSSNRCCAPRNCVPGR